MKKLYAGLQKPEAIFLLYALTAGAIFCFLVPIGAGFDETTHMARVWELSNGYIMPNMKLGTAPFLPTAFQDVSYRSRFFYTPVEPDYWEIYGQRRIDWNNFTYHLTRAVYFPLMYAPQAAIVAALTKLDAPVVWMYTLSRLANVMIYAAFGYLAIRSAPFGKWVLALLALTPVAVMATGMISSDPYTTGSALLFTAWALALGWRRRPMTWVETGVTLVVTGLVLAGKPGTIFLLILLAVLPWRETPARRRWLLLAGIAAVFAVGVVAWNLKIYRVYYLNIPGYGASAQAAHILANPVAFLRAFLNDFPHHGPMYLHDWIAMYPYGTGRVPPGVHALFLLLLGVLLIAEKAPALPPEKGGAAEGAAERAAEGARRFRWLRRWLLGSFAFGYLFTVVGMYLTSTRIGSETIEGVQGRYFLIVAPLLLLALVGLLPRAAERLERWRPLILGGGAALVLGLFMGGMYLSYYVTCGTSYYTPGLCYQPSYRNWDPDARFTPPLTQGMKLAQTFTADCAPIKTVRVWVGRAPAGDGGTTTLALIPSGAGEAAMSAPASQGRFAAHGWLELPVDYANSAGQAFTIEITSTEAEEDAAFEFGLSERHEYFDGQFLLNGEAPDADLLFQYGCQAP